MKTVPSPFKQVIFVCTNTRNPGERISCAGEGRCGQEVLEQLKAYIKTHKIQDVARAAKSGCQEQCENGPSVALIPQNQFLHQVTLSDVPAIIKTYLEPLTKR